MLGTALGRAPPAVKILAAKGAAEVFASRIARVGDEEDPAVPAPDKTPPKMRLVPQHSAQDEVVDRDESAHPALAVPVRAVPLGLGEAPLDLYKKWLRLSLTMLILYFVLLSSYQPATTSSRGGTRAFFYRNPTPRAANAGSNDPGGRAFIVPATLPFPAPHLGDTAPAGQPGQYRP
jgi:hypothetical protein